MNPTILGGNKITITLETGATEEIIVRQIPIRDYGDGFKHFNDEVALVAFLAGKPKEFALTLTPESYEEILSVGQEVNASGFFAFCRRRIEANSQQEAMNAAALAQLPEAARKTILEQGAKLMASQNSSGSSSIPQPRRV